MKIAYFVITLSLLFALSSCSAPQKAERPINLEADEPSAESGAGTEEVREPIYTYNNLVQSRILQRKIVLTYFSEPVLIGENSYVKLAGIIGGKNPLALIEIGGKGCLLSPGDKIGDYVVSSIKSDRVLLSRDLDV